MIERALCKLAEWTLLAIILAFTTVWVIGLMGIHGAYWLWEKVK